MLKHSTADTPNVPTLNLKQRIQQRLGRLRRWEFWPTWLAYIPVYIWIVLLGLRYRHFTVFTACNPMMGYASGLCGELKADILTPVTQTHPEWVPAWHLLLPQDKQWSLPTAQHMINALGGYPIVCKPNQGQRGRAVAILHDDHDLATYLTAAPITATAGLLLQQFVGGREFGILIARHPQTQQAVITSINEKEFPSVIGDGQQTLAELVMADARGRLIAPVLWRERPQAMQQVPALHKLIHLVEIGAHSRGTTFLDARKYHSDALQTWAQQLLDASPGLNLGRVDLRCPSADDFRNAQHLKILEINGVTSEPAHIYHPGSSLLTGYRALFQHWHLAFQLGHQEWRQGAATTPPLGLLRLLREDIAHADQWNPLNHQLYSLDKPQ